MKTVLVRMPDLSFDQSALEVNRDEWERLSKSWAAFDRVYLTERQAQALVAPLLDNDFNIMDRLVRPSIPEFTAVVQDKGMPYSTYVCFRKTRFKSADFFNAKLGKADCKLVPLIDAFVYVNNQGAFCNTVVTIANAIAEFGGRTVIGSLQLATYRHDDPFTREMFENDHRYFNEFAQSLKYLYLAIQLLSTERPEVLSFGRESVSRAEGHLRQGGKKKRKQHNARFVKVIRISEDAPAQLVAALAKHKRKIECPCWGVAGHWRTYKKSGKRVWISPYRKGRERHNPEAYQPKNYLIPKEAYC